MESPSLELQVLHSMLLKQMLMRGDAVLGTLLNGIHGFTNNDLAVSDDKMSPSSCSSQIGTAARLSLNMQ